MKRMIYLERNMQCCGASPCWQMGLRLLCFVFILLAFWQIGIYAELANTQYKTNLISLLSRDPFYLFDLLLKIAAMIIKGAVYHLGLKGIAMSIDMIVETDINYREKLSGDGAN